MLGRLFRQSLLPNLGPSTNSNSIGNPNASGPNFEDSYTREILYGAPDLNLAPVHLDSKKFRMLVAQDGGNLRPRLVLFDSASDVSDSGSSVPARNGSDPSITPVRNFKPSLGGKFMYSTNELFDYMFGRGIPTHELSTVTKVHILPTLAHSAVLITKLFMIVERGGGSDSYENASGAAAWNLSAPIDFAVSKSCSEVKENPTSSPDPAYRNPENSFRSALSSRFAVGIVIPLNPPLLGLSEVLTSQWDVVTQHLVVVQKLVSKKLIQGFKASVVNGHSPYVQNRRVIYPPGFLLNDPDILHQLNRIVKMESYAVNIPRLISSHSLMKHAIDHDNSQYRSLLYNWALEVINWLEFKDGRNVASMHSSGVGSNINHNSFFMNSHGFSQSATPNLFLAHLFTQVLAVKSELRDHYRRQSQKTPIKRVARVVIMTGNSVVAKKLVFILNGLIPNMEFRQLLEHQSTPDDSDTDLEYGEDVDVYETSSPASEPRASSTGVGSAAGDLPTEVYLDENGRDDSNTHDGPKVGPIPIRQAERVTSGSDSEGMASLSYSSRKGWEVPQKAPVSVYHSGTPQSLSGSRKSESRNSPAVQQIPIHGRNSLSTGSSTAYLSSSLNSSLSLSASNYSLSKLGSSFFDKWRNSFYQPHTLSDFDNGTIVESIPQRIANVSLKLPSPSVENEEFNWDPVSPQSRISRTQLMLDLCPGGNNKQAIGVLASVRIDRNKTSVNVPISSSSNSKNSEILRAKCDEIARMPLSANLVDDVLRVEDVDDTSFRPLRKSKALTPVVAFVDEFRPEFAVQSCPVNPKLELNVLAAMKNDLIFYQNHCGYEGVSSKTIFISLRAREIKLIELVCGRAANNGNATTPPPLHTPLTSYFVDSAERRTSNNYRTTIKKIYSPIRTSADRDSVNAVETQLEQLTEIVKRIGAGGATSEQAKLKYNSTLYEAVGRILGT